MEDRLKATQRWGAARCKVFCEVFVVTSGQDDMGDREKGAVNIPTYAGVKSKIVVLLRRVMLSKPGTCTKFKMKRTNL